MKNMKHWKNQKIRNNMKNQKSKNNYCKIDETN